MLVRDHKHITRLPNWRTAHFPTSWNLLSFPAHPSMSSFTDDTLKTGLRFSRNVLFSLPFGVTASLPSNTCLSQHSRSAFGCFVNKATVLSGYSISHCIEKIKGKFDFLAKLSDERFFLQFLPPFPSFFLFFGRILCLEICQKLHKGRLLIGHPALQHRLQKPVQRCANGPSLQPQRHQVPAIHRQVL